MTIERLNAEKIRQVIKPEYEQLLTQLEIHDTIESTNSYLINQGKLGAKSGFVCLAEQQTSGRGRIGKSWWSPDSENIYFSLLWRFSALQQDVSSLSIAVAVIVANVLHQYGVTGGIQLKWPNDVLFSNRKLAGILLERSDQAGIVIGIGINLNLSVEQNPETENWIDLTEITGQQIERNYLVGLLINELLAKLPVYERIGLCGFSEEWNKHDVLINQTVNIHASDIIIPGVMRGISSAGELLLEDEEGMLQTFCYGEVSVR